MTDIAKVIEKIRRGISQNKYPNETAVRTQVIQPVLHALGWDVYNPDHVCAEYSLKLKTTTRRIDLALCVSNRNPRCIIELKSTGYDLRQLGRSAGDRQLFEYSFHAGAPLALLTNGAHWRFYSTQSAGTYAERLVRSFDIEADEPGEVAAALDRYLSYSNTESGKAAHYAREDLIERTGRCHARDAIPNAWARLVKPDSDAEPDERLVALISETTASLSDHTPAKDDVARFLRRLKTPGPWTQAADKEPTKGSAGLKAAYTRAKRAYETAVASGAAKAALDVAQAKVEAAAAKLGIAPPVSTPSTASTTDESVVRYWLLGEERTAKNAVGAYVAVFTTLSERDPGFLPRVDPKLRGRKNRGVAQVKQELSETESVVRSSVRLPDGWWLLTTLSNAKKTQFLRIACEVAGIPFDHRTGLDIRLPNA